MTLQRVTVAAFAALLVISGIGSLMARQGPPPSVQPVELTDDAAETPPAAGGEVEEVVAPDLTDAGATAPATEPTEVVAADQTVAEAAPPADGTTDVVGQDAEEPGDAEEPDERGGSDGDEEGDSDDD